LRSSRALTLITSHIERPLVKGGGDEFPPWRRS
jgi:hypothetical protein